MAPKEKRHAPGPGHGAEIKSGGGKILAIQGDIVKRGPAVSECKVLTPIFDAIPQEIKDIPRWVVWRLEPTRGGGKPSKRPFCPMSGRPMSTSSRSYRCAFAEAKRVCQKGGWSGVGLVLAPDDGLVWFDLDHVRAVGDLLPRAQELVTALGSYTEVSPSGTGLRLVARGSLPPGTKQNRRDAFGPGTGLEVYDGSSARFLTITGHRINQEGIGDRQAGIDAILGKFMRPVTATPDPSNDRLAHVHAAIEAELAENPGSELTPADTALLKGLKQSPRFAALWDGDASGYPSGSEADAALCYRIARAVGDDPGRIDRIYRNGGLLHNPARTKEWDDQRGEGLTYGSRTVASALQHVGPDLVFDRYTDPGPRGLRLVPVSELLGAPNPPDWLIRDYLEQATLSCIFGDSGAMKSFVAIDMGLCIATGRPWHGHRVKQGPVIYIAGEGHGGISRRVNAWLSAHCIENMVVPLYISNKGISALEPGSMAELKTTIDALVEQTGKPALVIVDTLARNFGPGDENATKDMGRFIEALDVVKHYYGCAVLIVHHTGHQSKERARGSYSFHAAMDWEFNLAAQDDIRVLSCTKSKDCEPPAPMALLPEIVSTGWTDPETGEDITSVVLRRTTIPKKPAKGLSGSKQIAMSALRASLDEKGQVHIEAWRTEAYRQGVSLSDAPGSRRKAFQRAVRELLDQGLVETRDDHFWLAGQRDMSGTCPGHVPGTLGGTDRDTPL